MQQLLRSGAIQAKMQVSQPGDPAELEAEHMADAVTRQPSSSPVAAPCACSGSGQPCEECGKSSGVHRSGNGVTARTPSQSATRAVQSVVGGSGHTLDSASRAFFEPRFGRDFGQVRLHTGSQAAESAQAIRARAYTHGSDIVFNHGEYQPSTESGRHLLAHELTHVLHQAEAPATLHREADTSAMTLKEEAENLIKRYFLTMSWREDFSGIAYELNFALVALRYDYIMEVFDQLPSAWEDNVGAELISMTPIERLKLYALSSQGHKMLNILYEAIITGDVSDFEREQATKILEATKISQASYVAQSEDNLLTFAVREQHLLRDCYAGLDAVLLANGNIKVWYPSVRITQCDMFKQDVATFPDRDPTRPRELPPDKLVNVHLYDQGGVIVPIPAIALIDYANQSKNKTLSLAQTAFITGLTVGAGGFGGSGVEAEAEGAKWGIKATTWAARYGGVVESATTVVAKVAPWAAKIALWADRVAIVLPALASIIEDERDWIIDNVPFGDEIVAGVEKANAIIAYYGYARLGVDGLRFATAQVKGVLKARASGGIPSSFNAEQRAVLENIDHKSQELLTNLEETEKVIQVEQAAQQQAAAPAPAGGGAAPSAPEPAPASPQTAPAKASLPAPSSPTASAHAPSQAQQPTTPHDSAPAHTPAKPHQETSPTHEPPKAHDAAEPAKPDPQTTAKPGDFTPQQIADANKRLEDRIADPKNVRAAKPNSGYDLEVDLGDGQIYRRRPDGSWCLFRNPALCGITFAPKIGELSAAALRRLRTEESIEAAVQLKERLSERTFSEADRAAFRQQFRENPELAVSLLEEAASRQLVVEPPETDPSSGAADANVKTGRGGSAPGEAGRLGKDLSRYRATAAGDTWVCEEPKFSYTNHDGSTGEFFSDVGMMGPSEGGPYLIESKLGPGAALTDNQVPGYTALRNGTANPENAAARAMAARVTPGWRPGSPMPVLPVRLEQWRWNARIKDWSVTVSHWR